MKKYAKKKYITGGYTPVGIIPPSVIKENKESNDTFGSQLGKAGNFMLGKALPVASMALGIPGIGSALPTGIGAAVNSFQAKRKENNDSTSSPLISLVRELADSAKMNYGGQLPNGAVKIKGAKDQKLNDSATLIKGNPNKTDGNQYLVNGQRIHLDNNEVVKGNMVVSDSVINPATGNSFAKDVTDIERQIGKASKDTSLEGRNTLKHLSNRTKSLIQQQEMITGRSDGTHFQKGGPIEPNIQTVGNIKFDSNKSRRAEEGHMIVNDMTSKKDYGVVRNTDGSYRFYDQSKDKPMSEEQNIKKYYSDFISSKQYDKINGEKSLQEVATLPNDIERSLALERRKAFDNLKSSQIKAVTTTPVVLSNDIGSAYLNNTAKDKKFYSAHPKVSYSDKQAAELKATKEEILAHEYSHVKDDPNYKDYRFSKTDFRFHNNAKDKSPRTSVQEYTKNTTNRHDSHAWEYKADVNATRYLLLKEGIYDPLNEPFTKEHLDKVKNSSIKNKFMVKRLLENSKDENSVIKALNEISAKQSTSSNTQYAKYGGPIQAFDKGGPLPEGLNVKDFQEWAIKNGATIKADGVWGPQTEALYTQYKDAYGLKDHAYDYNELADLTDRMGNVKQMENKNTPNRILTESEKEQYQKMDGSVPTYNVDAAQLAKDNKERANAYTWSQPLPTSSTNIANQSTLPNLSKYRIQPETEGANITMSKLGALPDLFNMDGASETPPGIVENPIVTPEEQKKQEAAARFKALGAKSGDALQAASVVSQMFRAHQKPKLEKRYNVNAPITKESFDVTNPLQQSNRTFKNMVSGIDAGSVNTKRAVANSMYANRLSNDSNTIQQYDVMNQGARSNYEQRLAQRQAQNVQLSQYTDDLDQRNLGAYNNAKDVAWNSVNNFGKAINDKKSAYANLEMLKKIYSDVAKNIK